VLRASVSAGACIRDARVAEASALELLQRRASDVWEEYRADLAAHPEAIAAPSDAIAAGRVRVAVDSTGRLLGFSTVLPTENGRCELDDLFVEPDVMRRGVGRLLVEDLAARATAAGAKFVDVTANPNAVGFYSCLGFVQTGNTSTQFGPAPRMTLDLRQLDEERDRASITELMQRFFSAVSFGPGDRPGYQGLTDLFTPTGKLIRATDATPEMWTIEEFIAARSAAYEVREVCSFEESELSGTTDMFGNVAHRISPYRKRTATKDGEVEIQGVILTQFVRMLDGWRISSMAWDDEP
jgi:GNAT superfamily N-acetyltransferase